MKSEPRVPLIRSFNGNAEVNSPHMSLLKKLPAELSTLPDTLEEGKDLKERAEGGGTLSINC